MITYKQVLNKGLVKEATPKWLKVIYTLANTGKAKEAQKILDRAGIISYKTFGTIPAGQKTVDFVRNRAEQLLSRYLSKHPKSILGNIGLRPQIIQALSNPLRRGTSRFIKWHDNSLTARAYNLAREKWDKGQHSLAQHILDRFRTSMWENDPRFYRYSKTLFTQQAPSFGIRRRLDLKRTIQPFINKKVPPVTINQSDYVFGSKAPSIFKSLKSGGDTFMSGLLDVAKQYKEGFSRSHYDPTESIVVALRKRGLTRNGKPILFTPHLAQKDQEIRRAFIEGRKLPNHREQPQIYHPKLKINRNPFYQTIISVAGSQPNIFHQAIANPIRLPSGELQGQPIDLFHQFKPNKLYTYIQKGLLQRPMQGHISYRW